MIETIEFLESCAMQTVLYCPGCNEKFGVSAEDAGCPQCGQTLAPLTDAPTEDYFDLAHRGTCLHDANGSRENDEALVGRRLATYQIEAFLGRGGMARVYRAKHLMLERLCALKVVHPELLARQPELISVFFAEARAAAGLVHPHVVTVHNIGHDEGLHFIEMEYVPGRSMQRLVERAGPLDPGHATRLLVETCSALAQAHRAGMVHRDLKPANILVTDRGVAKLADFGLAKRVVVPSKGPGARGLVGTPYFMAPELFDGEPADKRSDVYAMGVTYFFLLTGRLPFMACDAAELAQKHATDPVPDMARLRPGVPAEGVAVLNRCLAKRPAERFADAAALYDDLRAVYRELQDTESLVREALADLDIAWQGSGNRFTATVQLSGGRAQAIVIEATASGPLADRLVRIYTVCAPLNEAYCRRALELNVEIPHGSIGIHPVNGSPHFIMGNTYPRATCDAEEIRQSVLTIARWAGDLERRLKEA